LVSFYVCVVVDPANMGWVLAGPPRFVGDLLEIEIGANYGS
jgi:hypothetical protein